MDAAKVAKPKPVRPVTIAADEAETPRLKALAATLPKSHVRIVATSAAKSADLVVSKTADNGASAHGVKLFTEQMHVIATGAIGSFADLQGKVVSFGPAGNAAEDAARRAFKSAGVRVTETPLDYANAFDGLASGDIDAVVVLDPTPSKQVEELHAPNLHLVDWPDGVTPPDGTSVSAIAPGSYPHLGAGNDQVRTLGIDAVLEPKANAARQPMVKRFLAALAEHSAALSKVGFDRLRADNFDQSNRRFASVEHR